MYRALFTWTPVKETRCLTDREGASFTQQLCIFCQFQHSVMKRHRMDLFPLTSAILSDHWIWWMERQQFIALTHVSSFAFKRGAHSILWTFVCACHTFMSNIFTSNGCNAVGDKIIGAYWVTNMKTARSSEHFTKETKPLNGKRDKRRFNEWRMPGSSYSLYCCWWICIRNKSKEKQKQQQRFDDHKEDEQTEKRCKNSEKKRKLPINNINTVCSRSTLFGCLVYRSISLVPPRYALLCICVCVRSIY